MNASECLVCNTRLTLKQFTFCSTTCRDDHLLRHRLFLSKYGRKMALYKQELDERIERALFDIHHL